MYRLGTRRKSQRRRNVFLLCLGLFLVVVIIAGVITVKKLNRPNTVLKQSAAVVSTVRTAVPKVHTFNLGIFSISLPLNWQQVTGSSEPYHIFRFEGGIGTPDEEQLEIYQDTIPQNFAVNRVLAVSSAGAQLAPIGEVSDNCADFTKSNSAIATSAGTPAKWLGTSFLCDLNNPQRNVVGTSSPAGINTVTLTGPLSGNHAFFFSFTDNSVAPDYSDFYSALSSFKLQ